MKHLLVMLGVSMILCVGLLGAAVAWTDFDDVIIIPVNSWLYAESSKTGQLGHHGPEFLPPPEELVLTSKNKPVVTTTKRSNLWEITFEK